MCQRQKVRFFQQFFCLQGLWTTVAWKVKILYLFSVTLLLPLCSLWLSELWMVTEVFCLRPAGYEGVAFWRPAVSRWTQFANWCSISYRNMILNVCFGESCAVVLRVSSWVWFLAHIQEVQMFRLVCIVPFFFYNKGQLQTEIVSLKRLPTALGGNRITFLFFPSFNPIPQHPRPW